MKPDLQDLQYALHFVQPSVKANIISLLQRKSSLLRGVWYNRSLLYIFYRFQGGNISDSVLNGSSIKIQMDTTSKGDFPVLQVFIKATM